MVIVAVIRVPVFGFKGHWPVVDAEMVNNGVEFPIYVLNKIAIQLACFTIALDGKENTWYGVVYLVSSFCLRVAYLIAFVEYLLQARFIHQHIVGSPSFNLLLGGQSGARRGRRWLSGSQVIDVPGGSSSCAGAGLL